MSLNLVVQVMEALPLVDLVVLDEDVQKVVHLQSSWGGSPALSGDSSNLLVQDFLSFGFGLGTGAVPRAYAVPVVIAHPPERAPLL